MKTKTKIGLTIGLLSLLAITGLTQSKYVRNSDVTLNVSQDTGVAPVTIPNNAGANGALVNQSYTVQKTGYYAIQLKGGDGGTNNTGTGGRGGVVEGVYKLNAGQVITYTLGGVGGFYAAGSDNRTPGASNYGQAGSGGSAPNSIYNASAREGCGGGGASVVRLGSASGTELLVAGGGGGGAGGSNAVNYGLSQPRLGGTGGSNISGTTGVIEGTKYSAVPGARNGNRNGADASQTPMILNSDRNSEAGGGAGGGYGAENLGGNSGPRNNPAAVGSGEGGNSYVNPAGYLENSNDLIHTTYASLLTGSTFAQVTGIGGSSGTDKAGQLRIAYLYTDDLQGASLVVNDIYRGNN